MDLRWYKFCVICDEGLLQLFARLVQVLLRDRTASVVVENLPFRNSYNLLFH